MDKEKTFQEPRIIKNRDIPLLARVLCVMQDICSLENRREWQRSRLFSITQRISDMPRSGSLPSGFDAIYAAMDEINEEHREQIAAYMHELKAAEKIINGITSRTMRTFVTMLYVDNIPAATVQRELNMTRRGFENARNAIEQAHDMESVVWHERYYAEE